MDMNYIIYGLLGGLLGGIIGFFIITINRLIVKKTIKKRMLKQKVQHFYTQQPGTDDKDVAKKIELKGMIPNEFK